jgi:hypothetical protein
MNASLFHHDYFLGGVVFAGILLACQLIYPDETALT